MSYVSSEQFLQVIQGLHQHLQDNALKMGEISNDIKTVKTDVGKLNRLITEGNGQPSLMEQFGAMKTTVAAVEKTQQSHGDTMKKILSAPVENKRAIIVAIISALGLLGVAALGLLR